MRRSLFLLATALTLFAIGCGGGENAGGATEPPAPKNMNSMKPNGGGGNTPTEGLNEAPKADFASVQTAASSFCLPCHDGTNKKGGMDVTAFKTADDAKPFLDKMIAQVESKKMPPANASKQPTDAERASLVTALKALKG